MKLDILFFGEHYSIEVNRAHYLRRLGFPGNFEVPEHILELIDQTTEWYKNNGNPWLEVFDQEVEIKNDLLYLNGYAVKSEKVLKRFQKYNVRKAMLIVATAGDRVDKETSALWNDYPDKSFFLDTYASSITEALVEFAVNQIKDWAGLKQENSLSRYSPGYPGWELKDQEILIKIIKDIQPDIPVQVSETSLLNPLKSQISLVGIYQGKLKEKHIKIECMQCSFNDCSCRKKEKYIKV